MKAVYPITMIKSQRDYYPYYVDIPDFDCAIHAEDPVSGMQHARRRIQDEIDILDQDGKKIPPSNPELPTAPQADIVTLVDIDTEELEQESREKKRSSYLFSTIF